LEQIGNKPSSDSDDEYDSDDDVVMSPALHYLVQLGDGYTDKVTLDIIQSVMHFFIQNGAEIDARDKNGLTPLMLAAQNRQVKFIQFLIDNKANVTLLNKQYSALYYALLMGDYGVNKAREDSALLLMKHGAEITPTIEKAYSEEQVFNKVKSKYLEIRVQTLEKQMLMLMQEVTLLKNAQNDRERELDVKPTTSGFFQRS